MDVGQGVAKALGSRCQVVAGGGTGLDGRIAEIAAGAAGAMGEVGVELPETGDNLCGGFNCCSAGLETGHNGMAYAPGMKPEAGPQAPDVDRTFTADNTFG